MVPAEDTGISEVAPPLADEEEVAAPTPEEVDEAAAEAEPGPTEGQCEAGYQHREHIKAGDPDSRSKRPWGQKKNFHIYLSYARKNEA